MSFVSVEPNATVSNGDSTLTGAATRHAALSDDSDASYVDLAGPTPMVLSYPDPVIPAGGMPYGVKAVLRGHHNIVPATLYATIGGDNLPGGDSINGVTTVSWGTTVPKDFAGASGNLTVTPEGLLLHLASPLSSIRIYEADLRVFYLAQPEAIVDQPTGTVTNTNLPEVAWLLDLDHFDPNFHNAEAFGMVAYEVKVFDDATYGAGGFDPDTSLPIVESGIRTDGIVSYSALGPGSSWRVTDPLPNDTYKAYVRVAQNVNGSYFWSAWDDGAAFTIDVDLPHTPLLEVAPDNAGARNAILITEGSDGDVESHFVEIQRSTDGGTTWEQIRTKTGSGVVDLTQYD